MSTVESTAFVIFKGCLHVRWDIGIRLELVFTLHILLHHFVVHLVAGPAVSLEFGVPLYGIVVHSLPVLGGEMSNLVGLVSSLIEAWELQSPPLRVLFQVGSGVTVGVFARWVGGRSGFVGQRVGYLREEIVF